MWRLFYLLSFSILVACSSSKKDKIIVPKLHAGFYSDALDKLDKEIESDPENNNLIDQKIFYCEQLEWPTTCVAALDAFKGKYGMSKQLIDQYIFYYQKHDQYQSLYDLIDRWDKEFELKDDFKHTYIHCLTQLNQVNQAKIELRRLLSKSQSIEDLSFASRKYLEIKDSLVAAYNLSKLYKKDPQNELMWDYGNILIGIGYYERGFEAIDFYTKQNAGNKDVQLTLAGLFRQSGRRNQSRQTLLPFKSIDTVSYLLSDWYKEDLMWDSAAMVLQNVALYDSLDRTPIWKLGILYEERGWLNRSLQYFESLRTMQPNDTLVLQKIDLIQRKIAYLQRRKFEESKIPVIEIEPIKN